MMKSQVKVGALLSYVNLGISNIIPLVYTPIMLRILGVNDYGLYSLANSMIGYLTLLNFGLGSTIVRYITKYKVEKSEKDVKKVIGLFFLIYVVLGVIVLVVGSGIMMVSDTFYESSLTTHEIDRLRTVLILLTINTALSFPMSVYYSITISYEKFIFRKLQDMLGTILVPMSNLLVLVMGYNVIGMAFSNLIVKSIVLMPISIYYCNKVINITPSFRNIPIKLLPEIVKFSAFVFLASIVDMLYWSTDKIILARHLGTLDVAVYSIGATFNTMMMSLSLGISSVLVPRINKLVFSKAKTIELSDIFIKVGRIQFILISLILTGFVVFGRDFIILWAGEDYTNSYYIAIITMFPLAIPLIQNVGINIIVAQNKHQFRAVVYFLIAVVNVITTWFVVPYFGGVGAAICSAISFVIGQGLIMNIYYSHVIEIDIIRFWKNILRMCIYPTVLCILSYIVVSDVDFQNVVNLIIGITSYSIIFLIGLYIISMNEYEKSLLKGMFLYIRN